MLHRHNNALSETNELWRAALGTDAPPMSDATALLDELLSRTPVAAYERLTSPYLRLSNVVMSRH